VRYLAILSFAAQLTARLMPHLSRWRSFLCVLVSSRLAFASQNSILNQIDKRVSHCGAVVVEPASRHLSVHFAQALRLREKVFLPQRLDYALTCLRSWRRCLTFAEACVFEAFGDGCEDTVDGCLQLVFLGFDFEFYVADFHLDFDGWVLLSFCQVGTC
jgi:hypothetical protein